MLAELVDHVVGVDPDRDWITLAVLDARSAGVIAEGRFPATRDGYDDAVAFVDGHSVDSERAWVIEGSAGYGRGLAVAARATRRVGHRVRPADPQDQRRREVRRPRRRPRRPRDARPQAAQHPSSSRRRSGGDPRSCRDQGRSGACPHRCDQRAQGASSSPPTNRCARSCAGCAPPGRSPRARSSVTAPAAPSTSAPPAARMRSLARRIQLLDTEVDEHDRALKQLLDQAAPQLIAERGIGYVTAAQFYIAWSHPGRCHSEAAFARLGGTSPVPQRPARTRPAIASTEAATVNSTGRSTSSPSPSSDATRPPSAYIARRTAEGKTDREAIRCIKRFLARRVWRLLEHPPISHLTDIEASVRGA